MNFCTAFAVYGPDVPKLATVLRVSEPDADRLKNYMMDHKPLSDIERRRINLRARNMAKKVELQEIRSRCV